MNLRLSCLLIGLLTLAACGQTAGPVQPTISDAPAVGTLSPEQLLAAYRECTQFGRIDDPRVKYSAPYCAEVQSAQLSAGYTARGTAQVDPKLNRLH